MRIDKTTSNKIGMKAKELRLLLHITDQKHFNPEEYGPDLYAADYEELMKLSDEMLIYLA